MAEFKEVAEIRLEALRVAAAAKVESTINDTDGEGPGQDDGSEPPAAVTAAAPDTPAPTTEGPDEDSTGDISSPPKPNAAVRLAPLTDPPIVEKPTAIGIIN